MLAEFLNDNPAAVWTQVMPGARACLFSLSKGLPSLPLRLEPLHFEALFCLAGSITLTRRDGRILKLGARQVLLLTDLSRPCLRRSRRWLGGRPSGGGRTRRPREPENHMQAAGRAELGHRTGAAAGWPAGAAAQWQGSSHWSRAAFADLERLPRSERARWCVWKSVELLYLLSAGGTDSSAPGRHESRHSPRRRRGGSLYVRAPRRASDHPRAQPPLLRFGHSTEGGFPRALWAAHTRLAARKAHGARRRAAAALGHERTRCIPGRGLRRAPSQFGANFLRRFGASPGKFRKNVCFGENCVRNRRTGRRRIRIIF